MRYLIQYAQQLTRRGQHFESGAEVDKYFEDPAPVTRLTPPFKFVLSSSSTALFDSNSGNNRELLINSGQSSGVLTINHGPRKGLTIDLARRKKSRAAPTAEPDYSSKEHRLFSLSDAVFPSGTPGDIVEAGKKAFNCSIKRQTKDNYSTGVRHMKNCELLLGRPFSCPMSEEERIFYTSYLVSKGVKAETLQAYLSHVRFYQLSQGVTNPEGNSQLGNQMIKGLVNQQRNPLIDAAKKTRRPITLSMLQLLGHSLSVNSSFSEYGKSLRWSIMVSAFWGSLRIGELLGESKVSYNPLSTLMASDVKFSDSEKSFSMWLRSPKVATRMGDVVEVWSFEEKPELDPVVALKAYVDRRNSVFGHDYAGPAFILEDGQAYTKAEFNKDLKVLLDLYPELASSPRDSWSGHSFRAGLATMLQTLGFDEESIKSWGRWRSCAYLVYLKDLEARRATRARLTKTFRDIASLI